MEAEVEYTALVGVKVDLESGDVVSAGIRATRTRTSRLARSA